MIITIIIMIITIIRYALASVELTFMEAQSLDCWTAEEREAYRLDTWHDILQQVRPLYYYYRTMD